MEIWNGREGAHVGCRGNIEWQRGSYCLFIATIGLGSKGVRNGPVECVCPQDEERKVAWKS
jgi:hypothetical protein